MRDIELSSMGQGYPSLLTTRRPLTKAVGVRSGSKIGKARREQMSSALPPIVLQKSSLRGCRIVNMALTICGATGVRHG